MTLEKVDDALIGRTIDGRYKIGRLIGRGGMGAVYEADHVGLDKRVAIKVITGDVDPDALARFRREARAAGRIVDDHVVEIFDVGEDGGHPYIAMEFVEGRDLRAVLKAGALPLAQSLEITRQILRGLTAIHGAGIVHRDIKPANILLTRTRDAAGDDHFVKIMDFGISKSDREVAELTRTGTMVGTPQYMAPEQLLGADADHRADLYAVGLTLYAMLTGEAAFAGSSTMELAAKQLRDPPPLAQLPQETPRAVVDALERVLEKAPADRFDSAAAFADALVAGPESDDARREAPTAVDRPSVDPAETKPSGSANKRRANKGPAESREASEPVAATAPPKRSRWLVLGGIAVALALVASYLWWPRPELPDRSGTPIAEPKRGPIDEARDDEKAGKLELAIAHYLEAHAMGPDPELLFRIGELYERMNRTAEAQLFFRRYLDESPNARDREAVEARIARLELSKASAQTQRLDAGVAPPIDASIPNAGSATPRRTIQVITNPEGAALFIGSSYIGPGGANLERPSGTKVDVACRLAGYKPGRVQLEFDGRKEFALCVLERLEAAVTPPTSSDEVCRCIMDVGKAWLCKRKYPSLCRCVQKAYLSNTLCPTQPTACPDNKCPFAFFGQRTDDTRYTCSTEHELFAIPAKAGAPCAGYEFNYPNKPGPLEGIQWCTVCQSSARPSNAERAEQIEVPGPAGRKCTGYQFSNSEPIETQSTGTVVCEKRTR